MATEPPSTELTFAPEKPTFVTIPREIRDAIYEYLLLFDGEIIPYPHDYEVAESQRQRPLFILQKFVRTTDWSKVFTGFEKNDHQLSVALLRVSKKIRDEAPTTLFGRNTFRMSMGTVDLWVKGRRSEHPSRPFWVRYGEYFRHVRVTFDARDVDTSTLIGGAYYNHHEILYSTLLKGRIDSNGEISQMAKEEIHKSRLMDLKTTFYNKAILLSDMDLETLEFDIGNVICPSGCCRRPSLDNFIQTMFRATDHSNTTYVRSWHSERVKLLGTWNDVEKQLAGECWGVDFDGEVGHPKEEWSISVVRLKELGMFKRRPYA